MLTSTTASGWQPTGHDTAHPRTGLPCPVCGDTVREVSFADTSLQYCPTCQTGGKPLADRRMSKLLR
ncbi:MAG TPA: zinc finger domain-containing protein [Blastococcus sp.]